MRAALRRRHEIHVAFDHWLTRLRLPRQRPVNRLVLATHTALERLNRQMLHLAHRLEQVFLQSAGITPFDLLFRFGDLQPNGESRAQHRLRPQHMFQSFDRNLVGIEILLVGPETNGRARIGLANLAHLLELAAFFAAGETQVVFDTTAADPDLKILRQCIDNGYTDTMQSAGVLIIILVEFSASMQAGQDQFDTRNLFFRMDIDRHAAAIIAYFGRTVAVNRDFDFLAVAGKCLIDAVVDDLVCQVIWPRRVCIHARPPPDRFETTKDLDVGRIVTFAHLLVCPKRKQSCVGAGFYMKAGTVERSRRSPAHRATNIARRVS